MTLYYIPHFFQKAPTQQFLCSIILDIVKNRADKDYIVELLRYDWLRCGHRFLPPELDVEEEKQSRALKKGLYEYLGAQHAAGTDDAEWLYHLRKGFVLEFSDGFIKKQGYAGGNGRHFLCFIPEREKGLYNFNKKLYLNISNR